MKHIITIILTLFLAAFAMAHVGAGKKLYFHLRQDQNIHQMDGRTQEWKDIPVHGSRW